MARGHRRPGGRRAAAEGGGKALQARCAAGRSGPRPRGRERGPPAHRAGPPTRLVAPRPRDPRLPPPRGHLFRSAKHRRRPCGCRRQLLAPPWCSDDAPGEPLRPLPRLSSRRPPPAGLVAQPGERCQGRAEGGGGRRESPESRESRSGLGPSAPPRGQVRRGSRADRRCRVWAARAAGGAKYLAAEFLATAVNRCRLLEV